MSLGNKILVSAGQTLTMQGYNAASDECGNKCGADCTIGLTGVTTFMFGAEVAEYGLNSMEGYETDSTFGIYVRATLMTGKNDKQVIEFDLMNGTAITVPACVFTPTIVYPEVPLIAPSTAPKFWVSMSVGKGYGMRGRGSHARRTFALTIDAGQTSDPLPIPLFADAVSFHSDEIDVTNLRIIQRSDTAGGSTLDNSVMGKTEDESVPYMPGARSFSVVNDGADPITIYVSWRLAFG